jgi:CspA family cold shock protein
MTTNTTEAGTVKWFNAEKGYGFITPENGGKDVFVHITAVHEAGFRSLQDGTRVVYMLKEERGKISATNLQAA